METLAVALGLPAVMHVSHYLFRKQRPQMRPKNKQRDDDSQYRADQHRTRRDIFGYFCQGMVFGLGQINAQFNHCIKHFRDQHARNCHEDHRKLNRGNT